MHAAGHKSANYISPVKFGHINLDNDPAFDPAKCHKLLAEAASRKATDCHLGNTSVGFDSKTKEYGEIVTAMLNDQVCRSASPCDLIDETSLQPYDYIALVPAIEAAGGHVTDWSGQSVDAEIRCKCSGRRDAGASCKGAGDAPALERLNGSDSGSPAMAYATTIEATRFSFADLRELMAKATPERSGDQLAGIAAAGPVERLAAQMALADLPLKTFLEQELIPSDEDEVSALIAKQHNATAFAPVSSMTVGAFREWLLSPAADLAALQALTYGLTPEMVAAVSKICRLQDLISVAAKRTVVTRFRTTIGLPGRLSTRNQPNHPTDSSQGILLSALDGLLMGSGDAVIGVNPATDTVSDYIRIVELLETLRLRLDVPTQHCCLGHVTVAIEAMARGAPVDLVFQSVAGSEKANSGFGVTLAILREAQEAGRALGRCPAGGQFMYLETGQGSALSADAHFGVDQQTMEARAYAVAREVSPLLVNTVVGFIGPEYLFNGKQIIRAGLEDHFCGKLLGLPMGVDVCYTNHADADSEDMDTLLTLLCAANVNFVITVPGADDVMLNYQSLSHHDAVFARETLNRPPAPEFVAWLRDTGLVDKAGRLTSEAGSLPPAFGDASRLLGWSAP